MQNIFIFSRFGTSILNLNREYEFSPVKPIKPNKTRLKPVKCLDEGLPSKIERIPLDQYIQEEDERKKLREEREARRASASAEYIQSYATIAEQSSTAEPLQLTELHTGARSKTPAPPPIVYLASDIREKEQPYPSTNKLIDPRINFYKNTKFSVDIVPLEILDSEINDNCPNHRSFKTVYENHEHILTFSPQ